MIGLKPARVGDGGDAQRQVGRGSAQRIAVGQQGGKRDGLRAGPRFQQHMRKARVQGQGGQLLAMRGDAACVQRAKIGKQSPRLSQRAGVGRGQEGQRSGAPEAKFQCQAGQIGGLDLGGGIGGQGPLFAARPHPVAETRRHPARAATALRSLGLCHAFGHQPRHAGVGVEPCTARFAGVHHHGYIGQGQRGFGDGRGQHDFAALHRGKRRALGGKIHRAIERANDAIRRQATCKQRLGAPDLGFAGQEHQQAAAEVAAFLLCLQNQCCHCCLQPQFGVGWPGQPAGFHRECAPF